MSEGSSEPMGDDIASAPRDGTAVVLCDANEPVKHWGDGCLASSVVGWWSKGEWRDHGDLGCNGQYDYAPTHWMPLPAAPNQRGE